MFDIGFWEILVIAVVLLLVMGPERLPEVAKQAAFFVRKARQGMFRLRNEMRSELGDDPFEGLKDARREVSNFKNDIKQFGRDLADSHDDSKKPNADAISDSEAMSESIDALGDDSTPVIESSANKPKNDKKSPSEDKASSVTTASSVKKKTTTKKSAPADKAS